MSATELQAARAIEKARNVMVAEHPFFAVLALSMKPICRTDIATMATDGASLFYNAEWVAALPARELRGVIAHEALHVANLHHTRRDQRDHEIFNLACDAVINRDLIRAGFVLPAEGFNVTGPDPFAGMNAEQAYRKMIRDGASAPQPCPWGAVLDAAPASQPHKIAEAEARAQMLVRQAVMVAKAASGPGDAAVISRLMGELNAPRQSWREIVRNWASDSSNRDYSWARPNKRYLAAGLIVPGFRPTAPAHIVCAIDTSGSMDSRAVDACLSEVQGVLDEGACDRVTVVYCDSHVHGSETWEAGERIDAKPKGGGGTSFAPAFAWIAEHCPDAAGVIYLTDLGSSDFGVEPPCPVIWGTYGTNQRAPFGDTVRIDPHE